MDPNTKIKSDSPFSIRVRPDVAEDIEFLVLLARWGRHPPGELDQVFAEAGPSNASDYARLVLNHYRPTKSLPLPDRGTRMGIRATQDEKDAWYQAAAPMARGSWCALVLETWCAQHRAVVDRLPPRVADVAPDDSSDSSGTEDDV